ncbi:MAG: AgmX/PglI C-terminal domain-containing protein [Deltaproteobacteria bacterium]|nr:AgmX/PglI C-terminal domain-containing protein [Deltaproteobacteria bacterium]
MLVLQVFIMRNGAFEGTEMVTGSQVEIGRDSTCALCLDDDGVSRKHALLFEHNGQLALRDLGSANGTRVNGEPVNGARAIGPRDDIAIGAFTLKVKVMSGQARAATPSPPIIQGGDPTRVLQSPMAGSSSGPSSRSPKPLVIGDISSADERTEIASPKDPRGPSRPVQAIHMAATEAVSPIGGYSGEGDVPTNTQPSPPPVPPRSDEDRPTRPVINTRGAFNVPAPSPAPVPWAPAGAAGATQPSGPDVTSPNAELPKPRSAPSPAAASIPPVQPGLAARPSPAEMALDGPIPDVAINSDGAEIKAIHFEPHFLAEEMEDDDADDPPWSLVQQLVRPSQDKHKSPVLELVHYRGETVVDHRTLREGDSFTLGEGWSRLERRERGVPKPIQIVRLKPGGIAEVFQRDDVHGKLLRGGQQVELVPGRGATPITDGELASIKIGNERVFISFAGSPQLIWTKEDAAEDRFARRINALAGGSSIGLAGVFLVASWVWQYRNADQEIIALEDEGFAEVELKEPEMEKPPEPEAPPEPIETVDPQPTPDKPTQQAKPDPTEKVPEAPPKPGVLDILNNIPKVNDTASSQNLTAALSNIKGVRVPGAAAGVKVSALIGKGPSSGVQFGGAAGGLATSGINSLIRKDGQAGALGGKGDRAVAGRVTTLSRQTQTKGQGELSKEEIMKVINQHIGEIQFCYEKQLRTTPGLAGRVVLEWTVNPQGRVSVVKVAQSSLASSEATNCMISKLKTWKFPSPRGGAVTIVFPFVFNTV